MMLKLFTIAIGAICIFTTTSYAGGGSGLRPLAKLSVEANILYRIDPETPFENPDGCGTSSFAVVLRENPESKDIYSTALTALVSGKQINMWFNGCYTTWWGGVSAPIISTFAISK